jgi:hypothetical protein
VLYDLPDDLFAVDLDPLDPQVDRSAPVDRLGLDDTNPHGPSGQRLDKNSLERSFGDSINVEPIDAVNW